MAWDSNKRQLTIGGLPAFSLSDRHVIEIILAIVLFFLGPIFLCFRFPDWFWVSVIGFGALLFLDGELGLIGGRDKLSVFKNRRKFAVFIVFSFAGAALLVMLYIFVLLIFFPPI